MRTSAVTIDPAFEVTPFGDWLFAVASQRTIPRRGRRAVYGNDWCPPPQQMKRPVSPPMKSDERRARARVARTRQEQQPRASGVLHNFPSHLLLPGPKVTIAGAHALQSLSAMRA